MTKLSDRKFCPACDRETEVIYVEKPDVELKICKECGSAVSVRYRDS